MSKKSRKQRERKRIVFKEHVKQNVKPLSAEQTKAKQFSRQVRKDSLEYLVNWKEHKDQWKFQKTRQIWLVKNMYNVERVPVKHFKALDVLNYKTLGSSTINMEDSLQNFILNWTLFVPRQLSKLNHQQHNEKLTQQNEKFIFKHVMNSETPAEYQHRIQNLWHRCQFIRSQGCPIKHFKLMKKYIKSMPEGPLKEKILAEALSMIEDKTKIKMDDIEQSLIDNTPPGQEKIAIKDRIIETKLKRAGKIAKALSKE